MASAAYINGEILARVDYTPPSTAVKAGDVIAFGTHRLGIAERDIAVGELGALVTAGGVWRLTVEQGGDTAQGNDVYFNVTNQEASTTGGRHFGFALETQLTGGEPCVCQFLPNGTTIP